MAAVIMVDRSASRLRPGVATAATNPSGAPANRVRRLKSIFGHFRRASEMPFGSVDRRGLRRADRCPGAWSTYGADTKSLFLSFRTGVCKSTFEARHFHPQVVLSGPVRVGLITRARVHHRPVPR